MNRPKRTCPKSRLEGPLICWGEKGRGAVAIAVCFIVISIVQIDVRSVVAARVEVLVRSARECQIPEAVAQGR